MISSALSSSSVSPCVVYNFLNICTVHHIGSSIALIALLMAFEFLFSFTFKCL